MKDQACCLGMLCMLCMRCMRFRRAGSACRLGMMLGQAPETRVIRPCNDNRLSQSTLPRSMVRLPPTPITISSPFFQSGMTFQSSMTPRRSTTARVCSSPSSDHGPVIAHPERRSPPSASRHRARFTRYVMPPLYPGSPSRWSTPPPLVPSGLSASLRIWQTLASRSPLPDPVPA